MDGQAPVNWLKRDGGGNTPMHEAAKCGSLESLPAGVVTLASMTIADNLGTTPIHCAAYWGHLDQVPKKLITVETMLLKSCIGVTPLALANSNGTQLDLLLGLDFPVDVKVFVNDAWWERNRAVVKAGSLLGEGVEEEGAGIEIF